MKHSTTLLILAMSLFFVAPFVAPTAASAEELPPQVFLNKITFRLVGRWPYPQEFDSLNAELARRNCSSVSCVEPFFRKYIQDKMNQPEFYALAYANVMERFGYKSPSSSSLRGILERAKNSTNTSTSVSEGRDFALIYRVFKQNLSIDELYSSQIIEDPIYKSLDVANAAYDQFSIDASPARSKGEATGSGRMTLDRDTAIETTLFDMTGHPNIAGLFSSTRFIHRFWNTAENSGRKRASTYFRLMMCDFMSPALERESEKAKERRVALGLTPEVIADAELKKIHEILPPDRHATQKDCAACHDRLDPVARTMRGMEVGISGEAFSGRLRYFNSLGDRTEIRADNFHDLVRRTIEQPKYLDCQIEWLLKSYLGNDLELAPQRFVEITDIVEKNKRRIKSTIEELLMLPEFRGVAVKFEEPNSYKKSKEIFSNCTDCHTNVFKSHPNQIRTRLARAAVCLDLPNDGKDAAMPPSSHWWSPSVEEIQTIRSWIQGGAPIGNEMKLFSPNEVSRILSPNNGARKCRQ